jgi:hypothetical protein
VFCRVGRCTLLLITALLLSSRLGCIHLI